MVDSSLAGFLDFVVASHFSVCIFRQLTPPGIASPDRRPVQAGRFFFGRLGFAPSVGLSSRLRAERPLGASFSRLSPASTLKSEIINLKSPPVLRRPGCPPLPVQIRRPSRPTWQTGPAPPPAGATRTHSQTRRSPNGTAYAGRARIARRPEGGQRPQLPISPPPSIAGSAPNRPTSCSGVLNLSSRSRWYCNIWRPTNASPGATCPSCARSVPTNPGC